VVKHKQAILWVGYTLIVSVMFAGMAETIPGSGKYDWNTLSMFLMLPVTVGLFAVPITSIVWATKKRKVPACNYNSGNARQAWQQAYNWEAALEYEIHKNVWEESYR